MAHFVSTDVGAAGSAQVAVIRGDGKRGIAFEDRDGRVIGRDTYPDGRIDDLCGHFLPASGQTAYVLTPQSDATDSRPDGLFVEHVWICAWHILYGSAAPILVEKPLSDAVVLVLMPDGRLVAPDNYMFDNLEDARMGVLSSVQAEWDRDQEKKTAKATDQERAR